MTKRLFTLAMMFICAFGAWADTYEQVEEYDFNKYANSLTADEAVTLGTAKLFSVTDGENSRNMYQIVDLTGLSLNNRFATYTNSGVQIRYGNYGLIAKDRPFSICNLEAGDKIYMECSDGWQFLDGSCLEENPTAGATITSGTTYNVKSTLVGTAHLDLKGANSGSGSMKVIRIIKTKSVDWDEPSNTLTLDYTGSKTSLTVSDVETSVNVNGTATTMYYLNAVSGASPYGFFASSLNTIYNKIDKGIRFTNANEGVNVAVTNLQKGDEVTINFVDYDNSNAGVLKYQTPYSVNQVCQESEGNLVTIVPGSTIASGTKLVVTGDGSYLSFNANKYTYFTSITIKTNTTSTTETVTKPTIDVSNGTVTITSGTAANGSICTTYYTTDGTPPTSESTAYTEPFNIDNSQGDVTIKAITYINGLSNKSDIASTVIEAASFDITVNQTTGGTFTVKVGDADFTDASTTAKYGQIITLDNTPANGYTFTSYSVTKTNGTDVIEVNNNQFTMPGEAVTITATFTEKTAPTVENLAAASLTYTGEAQNLITTPIVIGGTITYSTTETGEYSATIPTGINAGNYNVWYKVVGDETHNDIAATEVEGVKINKATYTIEGTATATAASGTPIKNITIAGLTVKNVFNETVTGSWAFSAEETAELSADNTTEYTATFIPSTEDNNYEELTTQITPTITSVSYTVEHYQQNIDDNEYTKVDGDTQTINTGNVGEQTAAEAKTYEGFTAQSFDQATINADGSTVVKIYYTRNSYTITFDSDGGSDVAAISGKYGSAVTAPADPIKNGSTFDGWFEDDATVAYVFSTMPARNFILRAHWTASESVGLTKVSTSKKWTFAEVAENTSYSSLTNINEGLYIRANSSKTISRNTNSNSLNIQFSDESSKTSYTVALKLSANSSFAPATTLVANDAVTNADAGCLAVTSDIPGTFYVAAKASANEASKYVQFIFNGNATSVASDKLNATSGDGSYGCKYEYTAAEAGTFVIGSTSVGVNVYCIRFEPTKYELTSSILPENAGTITKKVAGTTENTTDTEFYKGTEVELTATANAGYEFKEWQEYKNDEWTKIDSATEETLELTMDGNKNIKAVFEAVNYTFKATAGENGSITVMKGEDNVTSAVAGESGATYPYGTTLVLTPTATNSDEYEFDKWTTDGTTELTTSNDISIDGTTNVLTVSLKANLTVVATFKAKSNTQDPTTYSITLPSEVNGNSVTANVNDLSSVAENTSVTLTINTAENYTLTNISATGVTLSGSGVTRTFTMPAANVTITATWTINQTDTGDNATSETYTVTETGGIEVSSVTTNNNSSSITIPAQVGSTSVTSISNDAFSSITNKSYIKSVDLSATAITNVEINRESGVFSGFPEETMIYMPAGNSAAEGQKNVVIGGTCSDFVMTDEKSYSIPTSFTATNATLSRSFTSEKYCTLCLPYAIPAGNLDGKIYEFTSIEGTTVKMTEDADGLDANKPYIFVPSAAAEQITTTSVIVNMSATPNTEKTDFTFKGIFGRKEFTSDEISGGVYGFAADSNHGASIGQFVKASNGAWTEGMRAYLEYSGNLSETGVASTRGEGLPEYLNVVLIHANGSTTNIGRLELMTAEDGSPVYNLNGQRVDNSYKGLVIKNGKKVVKK